MLIEITHRAGFSAKLWYMFVIVVKGFANLRKEIADCVLSCVRRTGTLTARRIGEVPFVHVELKTELNYIIH